MKVKKIIEKASINLLLMMLVATTVCIKLADVCDAMFLKTIKIEKEEQ